MTWFNFLLQLNMTQNATIHRSKHSAKVNQGVWVWVSQTPWFNRFLKPRNTHLIDNITLHNIDISVSKKMYPFTILSSWWCNIGQGYLYKMYIILINLIVVCNQYEVEKLGINFFESKATRDPMWHALLNRCLLNVCK